MVRHSKKRPAEAPADQPTLPANFGDSVLVRFYDAKSEGVGDEIAVPLQCKKEELTALLKAHLGKESDDEEYTLVLSDTGIEVLTTIEQAFIEGLKLGLNMTTESQLKIGFFILATFRVRPVARLSGSLSGHRGNIVCCQFSPDGILLATGSGDCQARLWDLSTTTPFATLAGHTKVVECLTWSADNQWLATGSEDKTIRAWNISSMTSGIQENGRVLSGHKHTVVALAFQPVHLMDHWSSGAPKLLSAARDGSIKIWDVVLGQCLIHLDGHTKMCTAVRWSGIMQATIDGVNIDGPFIYSAGRDMSLRVWHGSNGRQLREVRSHGHWVNALSTNTDALCRYGPFTFRGAQKFASANDVYESAKSHWEAGMVNLGEERIVTCSDDNTLGLWNLLGSTKPVAKMVGHQKAVLSVSFSPNGRFIASAGCDSCIKLWNGRDGAFITTYRGHVGPVHQVAWSADSSMFVSGSADSTLKIWATKDKVKSVHDLPGHADEIFAVDWSPDGSKVGSGGRDKQVYLWSH